MCKLNNYTSLVIIYCIFVVGALCKSAQWDRNSCPTSCTCQQSHLDDLSISRWIQETDTSFGGNKESNGYPQTSNQQVNYNDDDSHEDNSFEEDESSAPSPLVKSILCLIQSDPKDLLKTIPRDVQALTLLQPSVHLEGVLLPSSMFLEFHDLVALEIRGKDTNLTFLLDKPLEELQYLNLEGIKLRGMGFNMYDSTDDPYEGFDYIPKIETNIYNLNLEIKSETMIIPYEEYVKQQKIRGETDPLVTFNQWNDLTVLRIHDCGLLDIQWEMFNGLNHLLYLSLEHNGLRFIPSHAFHGTPNLKTLSLAHNDILNLFYRALAGLMQLEKLDLSYNQLTKLSELSFPPFPSLLTTDLRDNPIKNIYPSTFAIMNATNSLIIGSEETALELTPNAFLSLELLQVLTLSNVNVDLLTSDLFNGLVSLKSLILKGKISSIQFDAFSVMKSLSILILRDCNIETISMDAFYGLKYLRKLDLSHNLLRILPPGLFDEHIELVELYLDNNHFVELPGGIFVNLKAKLIRLTQNPWHCSCAMSDWNPMIINKYKKKSFSKCHYDYEKGSICKTVDEKYVYENKMAPKCLTPLKYKNWSVFHVLRKQIRCNRNIKTKEQIKLEKKAYLKLKAKNYKESNTTVKPENVKNILEEINNEIPFANISPVDKFSDLESDGKLDQLNEILNKPEARPYLNDEINDLNEIPVPVNNMNKVDHSHEDQNKNNIILNNYKTKFDHKLKYTYHKLNNV